MNWQESVGIVSRLAKPQTGHTNTDSRRRSLMQGFRCLPRHQIHQITSRLPASLLLYPKNRVFCRLGDAKFDDGLGWNLDLLLRLGIKTRARLPLLLCQLAKTGQDEFAVLFDLFVREVAERIEEYSSGSFVGLGGGSDCGLKFTFGHV